MKDFADKVGIVTGSASGIGLATASALAEEGMRVVLLDSRSDVVEQRAEELRERGHDVFAIAVDVTDAGAVNEAANQIGERYGPIHFLMNNAAVFLRGSPVTEIEDDVWSWLLGVNLYGPIHCIRSMMPLMRHGEPAHIVNTASISGMAVRDRKNGAYAVTKFGLVALSEALRHDLSDTSIGVSVVFPGLVASDFYVTSAQHRGELGGPNLFPTTPDDNAQGMPPPEVAARILSGVRDGRFYIATHTNTRKQLEDRNAEIMAAYDAAARWHG